jgi:hypothetical protein
VRVGGLVPGQTSVPRGGDSGIGCHVGLTWDRVLRGGFSCLILSFLHSWIFGSVSHAISHELESWVVTFFP